MNHFFFHPLSPLFNTLGVALWLFALLANAADEYTSQWTTHFKYLAESNKLARDPKTHKFSLRRGLLGKFLFMLFVTLFSVYSPIAAIAMGLIAGAPVLYAASVNYRLIQTELRLRKANPSYGG